MWTFTDGATEIKQSDISKDGEMDDVIQIKDFVCLSTLISEW